MKKPRQIIEETNREKRNQTKLKRKRTTKG